MKVDIRAVLCMASVFAAGGSWYCDWCGGGGFGEPSNRKHVPCGEGWCDDLTKERGEWVCEVWQSAYGHKARKRTWLFYVGDRRPMDMRWGREPGTHQVGWFDRIKPTLSKREAIKSPPTFAAELVALARHSRARRAA